MIETHLPALQVVVPLLAAPFCALFRKGPLAWAIAMASSWVAFAIAVFSEWLGKIESQRAERRKISNANTDL